ncbi:MAG TPA: arginine--tRNA ligase [Gemmataceae bacterium]|nr:arginine--tRNA ligase [Gemmataceae bacterium]
MTLLQRVQQSFRAALTGLVADPEPYAAMVRPAQDPRFGDYQANCAMALGKALGRPPRDVAADIVRRLPLDDFLEPPEVAGPGFINVRLRRDWIAAQLRRMAADDHLGAEPADPPRTFVIDFSSPNVAKPMHVGHLRSTIIGDALARLLRFLRHRVITDNHLGDWGTQFGMLLYGFKHFVNEEALKADPVAEMARLYVQVRQLIKPAEEEDEEGASADRPAYTEEQKALAREVQEAARQETAKLHAGDPENVALWRRFMPWCQAEIDRIYDRLGVRFDHTLGESFYNPMLPDVVRSLEERGIARPSEGAVAVFFGESETPALVRKSDGAFTYTTSDLATIRHRLGQWHADAILYVVDFRQGLHFRNLFDIARRWGCDKVELEHVSFGSVLDPKTKKPIKTREGSAVATLAGLLDEAVAEGARRYEQTRQERQERKQEVPDLTPEEQREVAEVVGLGAVKYADLSQNRTSDYAFSWDKMLSTEGNTATYMQYAYARIRSIFRKGGVDPEALRREPPLPPVEQPEERALALQLLRFPDALETATADYRPNVITAYLWDLAKAYSQFYDRCHVLNAPTPELRQGRLLLCDLTARVIRQGLDLLGIRTVERM